MKNINVSVLFLVVLILAAGCSSVPRVTKVTPAASGYRYSQEPARRDLEYRGPDYENHLRMVQAENLAHERRLIQMEHQAEEIKAANELGFTNVQPRGLLNYNQQPYGPGVPMVPPAQMPGVMPSYVPAPTPLMPPPAVYAAPVYGGYAGGYGTVNVRTRVHEGRLFGFLPYSGVTTSYYVHTVDPVYAPAPVDIYTSYGGGISGGVVVNGVGRQPRVWGPHNHRGRR